MNQAGGLVLNGFDDLGVAMPGGDDGNPGGKVQKAVPVRIFYDCSGGCFGHQRIGTRIGRRDNLLIPLDDSSRSGSGEGSQDARQLDHLIIVR